MKKKDKMLKKLKERLGVEDDEEDDDEDEAEEQVPLAITQGLGEDKDEEGAKPEKIVEAKQAPKAKKKRKAKIEPIARPPKKV